MQYTPPSKRTAGLNVSSSCSDDVPALAEPAGKTDDMVPVVTCLARLAVERTSVSGRGTVELQPGNAWLNAE